MSEAIDQVWLRLRVGRAAKPTARELGLCTDTVREDLLRCGGIRPEPRRRAAARLRLEERQEISRDRAAGLSVAGDRDGAGTLALDGEPRGRRQRRGQALSGGPCRPSSGGLGDPTQAVQARGESAAAPSWRRSSSGGGLAADRRLVERDPPGRAGDAGVAREHLPQPLRPIPLGAAQGTHPFHTHWPGDLKHPGESGDSDC